MTIGFLQTARYSAQPLARHIDTPEQQAPVYTCMDTLLADMLEDARQIRKRSEREKPGRGGAWLNKAVLKNEDIVRVIEKHPGITTALIAAKTGHRTGDIHARLNTLVKWGCVRFEWQPGQTKKVRTYFRIQGVPVKQPQRRDGNSNRSKLYAFILANPGCSTADIAEHLETSVRRAGHTVASARSDGMPIVSKRGHLSGGMSNHWIEEDAE